MSLEDVVTRRVVKTRKVTLGIIHYSAQRCLSLWYSSGKKVYFPFYLFRSLLCFELLRSYEISCRIISYEKCTETFFAAKAVIVIQALLPEFLPR